MVLRNSIKVELLEDPVQPVSFIIDKVPKEQLINVYDIGSFSNADDFLTQLALQRGRFKGGEPDLEGVARSVLNDWNRGRIRYFTVPPSIDDTVEGNAELVTWTGEVYPMGKTIDFAEREFRNFQVQHVFELVQKKHHQGERNGDENNDGEEEEEAREKVWTGEVLPPEEKAELNELAREYQAISFIDL
jgi:nuclear GTP-binding protein